MIKNTILILLLIICLISCNTLCIKETAPYSAIATNGNIIFKSKNCISNSFVYYQAKATHWIIQTNKINKLRIESFNSNRYGDVFYNFNIEYISNIVKDIKKVLIWDSTAYFSNIKANIPMTNKIDNNIDIVVLMVGEYR